MNQNGGYTPQFYDPRGYYAPKKKKDPRKDYPVIAFALGITSLLLFAFFINIPMAIVAIVFGIIALTGKQKNWGLALAGIIFSVASMALTVFFCVCIANMDVSENISEDLYYDSFEDFFEDDYWNDSDRSESIYDLIEDEFEGLDQTL